MTTAAAALLPYLLAFALALVVSLLLTPAIRDFAIRRRFLDAVGSARKIHTRSVPRLGGVAIVASWLLAAGSMLVIDPSLRDDLWGSPPRTLLFLVGGVIAAAVGFVDDLRGLRARYKLAAQLAIGALLCFGGYAVQQIQLPGGAIVSLGPLGVPFTMLWIAGVMNAMNLIDGLDGLAAGVAGIALCTVFVSALWLGKPVLALHSAALIGALLGFLFYNFNPASIFMGDAGSLFLGYFLAFALLRTTQRSPTNAVEIAVPLLVMGLPIADTALAVLRRVVRGQGLFSPDRDHLHHRLLARGLTQRRAVVLLYAVCGLLAVGGTAMVWGGQHVDRWIVIALVAAAAAALYRLKPLRSTLASLSRERRRNQDLRMAITSISERFKCAGSVADVLGAFDGLIVAVAASQVKAQIGTTLAEHGLSECGASALRLHFPVHEGTRRLGNVEIAWDDGRAAADANHVLAVEEVCENAARALRRVPAP